VTSRNDDVIADFRANAGAVTQALGGALADLEIALLHHRGRSSSKEYITPLSYMTHEGDYLLLGSFGGAASEPLWVKNVENASEVTVEVGTRTVLVKPAVLRDGPERDRLYAAAREHWPFVLAGSRPPGPFPLSG
jgi:deazaflavin-dependent oxidoreductase (nitroreductase family)